MASAASIGGAVASAHVWAGTQATHAPAIDHPRGKVPHVRPGQSKRYRPPAGAASANPNCKACSPPLTYTLGSPVAGGGSGTPGHATLTPVYWAPSGYSYTSTYKAVINGYLDNVAAASRQNGNVFALSTQYYQQANATAPRQPIEYVIQAGAEVDDSSAYPAQGGSTGCVADAGYTACVTDSALQSELRTYLVQASLPMDDTHIYVVLFPAQVETCEQAGGAAAGTSCSTNTYCAYHSGVSFSGHDLIYANQPFPRLQHCADPFNGPQAPNGDSFADAQISLISHEANEAITDWAGAWSDSAGYENGDECAYVYGDAIGSTGVATDGNAAGTAYNQVVGSGRYYTQEEFSNEDYARGLGDATTTGGTAVPGCRQSEELPTAVFTVPAVASAGASMSFDGSASTDSDGAATDLSYRWTWGDGSPDTTGATAAHVFVAGTFTVALTVTDADGWSGSASHQLSVVASPSNLPCSAATLAPGASSPQPVGSSINFTAAATACANPQYRFWLLAPGGSWTLQRDYGAPAWTWNTTGLAAGTYQAGVWARQSGATGSYEAYGITTFVLGTNSCASATLVAAVPPPQPPGGQVLVTVSGNGCSGAQYQFWLLRPGGGWTVARPYSTANGWTWNTAGYPEGTYQVGVWVKATGSTSSYDAYSIATFALATPKCLSAAIAAGPASPQPVGTWVTFTAGSLACSGPQYEFWEQPPGGSWRIVQAYGTTTSYTWDSAGAPPGTYRFGVWARAAGSPNSYDSYSIASFELS